MTYEHNIDHGVKARESFRVVHLAPPPPDYTADGLIDIVVDRVPYRPYTSMRTFTRWLTKDSFTGDPVDGCEGSGGEVGNITDGKDSNS